MRSARLSLTFPVLLGSLLLLGLFHASFRDASGARPDEPTKTARSESGDTDSGQEGDSGGDGAGSPASRSRETPATACILDEGRRVTSPAGTGWPIYGACTLLDPRFPDDADFRQAAGRGDTSLGPSGTVDLCHAPRAPPLISPS